MSQQNDRASPEPQERTSSPPPPSAEPAAEPTGSTSDPTAESAMDTNTEQDNFEDAMENGPVRSLTKRSVSTSKSADPEDDAKSDDDNKATVNGHDQDQDPPETADDKENKEKDVSKQDAKQDGDKPRESEDSEEAQQKPSPPPKRLSSTSQLDNVNLDDEALPPSEEPKSPVEKEQTSKSMSLSSITSALPSMPWSPTTETPSRTLNSAPAPANAQPPPAAATSATAPPPRKITSPFSWLSRNSSSKEKDTVQVAQTSPRRNTASSIATLTSNPEMMLSKLEEENDGEGQGDTRRTSLRDRFKLLRMREEAGITSLASPTAEENAEGVETSNGGDAPLGDVPPPSSVPEPDANLPPGTMSGLNAGPSAMPETEVDWDLWQSVVYEGPSVVARTSAEELNRAIATGIPSAIRGVIWQVLAQSKNDELEHAYKELSVRGTEKDKTRNSNSTTSSTSNGNLSVQPPDAVASSASSLHSENSAGNGPTSPQVEKNAELGAKSPVLSAAEKKKKDKEDTAALQKLEKTIRRDLGARTSFSKYAAAAGLQDGLFGVCKAYALYDEGVGYAQGMNFLIMPLLFNMPEEEAFSLLVRLMHHYGLRELFIQDMPGLHKHLYQFERLLEDFEPALYCHLHRRGISPHLYATQWFLTLFAYRFPLQLVLRIYDLILSEGLSAILRFGITLMQKNAETLLGMSDMQQLTVYLKDKLFDVYIDKDPSQGSLLESGFFGSATSNMEKEVYRADQLIRDACEVKIAPETLKLYATEWEEKTRAEKEREAELLELRTSNQKLTGMVRKLEERVEAVDHEQAALATDLVRTKVSNEELKDENESLKGQVRELKVVIEKQPQEIEEQWTIQRDELMKRNQKVHEENEELEKTLQDLEEQLVQTKMRYAEINSQHETLNRKWSDLKRQFA